MSDTRKAGRLLILYSWAGLVVWQLCWHALLPAPWGNTNWILAVAAAVPLLLLWAGVMNTGHKALTWGTFLVMMYFIVGVMEVWSNAAQRMPAIVQLALTGGFFLGLVFFSRPSQIQLEQ